jgi:site-specific recombinase XerD
MDEMVWEPPFGVVMKGFIDDLAKRGRKESTTICNYTFRMNDFSKFLTASNVSSFKNLNPVHITDYLASISTSHKGMSLTAVLSQLRVFCRYLYLSEHTEMDLSLLIPKSQVQKSREHLPSIWSKDDIENITKQIDRGSPSGKRDYAIISLVSKVGLRVSDVVDLKLSNLDWENECVSIVQRKNCKIVSFPLAEVGDAIIDYLKNGRPITESKHVFVKHNPPFDGFTEKTRFHNVISRYMHKAGIVVDADKSHGLHSLRYSMATGLHQKGVPAEAIAGIMGHKSPEMTKHYIRVDVGQLRTCTISLEVPE